MLDAFNIPVPGTVYLLVPVRFDSDATLHQDFFIMRSRKKNRLHLQSLFTGLTLLCTNQVFPCFVCRQIGLAKIKMQKNISQNCCLIYIYICKG